MSSFLTFLSPVELGFAVLVVLVAGVVKGMVGFAMPMIMISGLSFFLPPELALAGLLFPTVATNGFQALRQGAAAAWESIVRFRLFLIVGGVLLLSSAQLVESTIGQLQHQLSDSATIKENMQQLIEDTRNALTGSSENAELGQELIRHLSAN